MMVLIWLPSPAAATSGRNIAGEPFERIASLSFETLSVARASRTSGKSESFRRSEEHTSELQSPCNLVCRLLLEKKKYNANAVYYRFSAISLLAPFNDYVICQTFPTISRLT